MMAARHLSSSEARRAFECTTWGASIKISRRLKASDIPINRLEAGRGKRVGPWRRRLFFSVNIMAWLARVAVLLASNALCEARYKLRIAINRR